MLLDWDDIEDATDYQYRYKLSSDTAWGTPATTTDTTALLIGPFGGHELRLSGALTREWHAE